MSFVPLPGLPNKASCHEPADSPPPPPVKSSIVKRIRNQLILLVVASLGAMLLVQYLRILKPAQARAVRAACNGMRPSPTNPVFGSMAGPIAATDFSLQDASGKQISLSQYRGKIVIVNFWASWCSGCRSEKPSLESFQDDNGGDELVILALASDRDWAPVRRAMMGFEVATAEEVLRKPETYGVRNPKNLSAKGGQVVVSRIDGGRAASKGGLRRLDRIVSLNGAPVESRDDLDQALRASGDKMTILINRNGVIKTINLTSSEKLNVLIDPPDDDGNLGAIAKGYGITAVPESFVVDRSGNIRHYFINKRNWGGDVAATCMQDLIDG
ncbi:MAG: redoxin domain-containing protein [Myxococcales bacterium]|nr:redoxin domain-containing protein [Myxococcales bacterium]